MSTSQGNKKCYQWKVIPEKKAALAREVKRFVSEKIKGGHFGGGEERGGDGKGGRERSKEMDADGGMNVDGKRGGTGGGGGGGGRNGRGHSGRCKGVEKGRGEREQGVNQGRTGDINPKTVSNTGILCKINSYLTYVM